MPDIPKYLKHVISISPAAAASPLGVGAFSDISVAGKASAFCSSIVDHNTALGAGGL